MRSVAKTVGVILVMALAMVAMVGCIAVGGYACWVVIKALLTII